MKWRRKGLVHFVGCWGAALMKNREREKKIQAKHRQTYYSTCCDVSVFFGCATFLQNTKSKRLILVSFCQSWKGKTQTVSLGFAHSNLTPPPLRQYLTLIHTLTHSVEMVAPYSYVNSFWRVFEGLVEETGERGCFRQRGRQRRFVGRGRGAELSLS